MHPFKFKFINSFKFIFLIHKSVNINFNNIHTSRQTRFMTSKANRLKVGMNLISNRLYYLNGKIEMDWLNLSYNTYKVKCKKLFL